MYKMGNSNKRGCRGNFPGRVRLEMDQAFRRKENPRIAWDLSQNKRLVPSRIGEKIVDGRVPRPLASKRWLKGRWEKEDEGPKNKIMESRTEKGA